ncbi:hypothetical protein [Streptomyces otsuchiensis]|uniref:hypothetical protein n=1 Tax=Streptomyces otsuchiensis TaxID=2681388 RepID=UPI00102F455A|nr:hypothetical protein [Streptomyces otsuchiensis]
MDQYAGRLLADRYRLPRPPSEVFELVESRAFDTASGQEVLVRQVPLPEVVDPEVLDGEYGDGPPGSVPGSGRATRTPEDPVVRRALEAAAAAAALPDHARLDQIFDVFVQGDGIWIVSELVPARPLAALLAEHRMGPYRAAEVAADLLAALRVVHAHGWSHRNITARTVLICDDGRALLTGLAAGAAEEVLCGYDPFPVDAADSAAGPEPAASGHDPADGHAAPPTPGDRTPGTGIRRDQPFAGPGGPVPPGLRPDTGLEGGTHPPQAMPPARVDDEPDGPGHPGPAPGAYALPPGWNAPGRPAGHDPHEARGPYGAPASNGPREALPPARDTGDHRADGALPGTRYGPDPGYGPGAAHQPDHGPGTGYGPGSVPDHDEPTGRAGQYADQIDPRDIGPYTDRIELPGDSAAPAHPGDGPEPGRYDSEDRNPTAHLPQIGHLPPGDDPFTGGPAGGGEFPAVPGEFTPGGDQLASGAHELPEGWDVVPGGGPVDPEADQAAADSHAYHPDRQREPLPGAGPGPRGPVPLGDPAAGPGSAPPPRGAEQAPQPSRAALERASRSGAIAAYRAGTRAGADAVHGAGRGPAEGRAADGGAPGYGADSYGADPYGVGRNGGPGRGTPPRRDGHGPQAPGGDARALPPARGSGPTELPGTPRPSRPIETGWESAAPRNAVPARRPSPPTVSAAVPDQEPPTEQLPRIPAHSAPGAAPGRGTPEPQPPGTGIVPDAARRYRGPDNALAAERARQARMTMVGAVTERWAPEQAGPVYDHWRLAPPVGPAADLWALGALLFRAVQGHPPYPEESAAELTQAVCGEQPAFAEECGALRPVVESLLRLDPTERPSAEELRGWLRSIIRAAPEPDVGRRTAALPPMLEAGRPADPARLPMVRHRGELVSKRPRRESGDPRNLGRILLVLVFCLVAGAMAYALLFLPDGEERGGQAGPGSSPSGGAGEQDEPAPDGSGDDAPGESGAPDGEPGDADEVPAPDGFESLDDPLGFRLTVPEGWERSTGSDGQVVFAGDGLRLTVVPGRDGGDEFGEVPMDYQLQSQPELQPYRDAPWRSSGSLHNITVGQVDLAEGDFLWDGGDGRQFARNRAMLIGGGYHVVMLQGTESDRDDIGELFPTIAESYRAAS